MFRLISILAFILVAGGIVLHYLAVSLLRPGPLLSKLIRLPIVILTLLLFEQRLTFIGRLKKLAFLLACACFVVLFATGFGTLLILNTRLTGWLLMVHVTFGAVFAASVAFLSIGWARHFAFGVSDIDRLAWIARVFGYRSGGDSGLVQKSCICRKVLFWTTLLLSLPLGLSVVLSMFPIFGTQWQYNLFYIHRYSALAFSLTSVIFIYLTFLSQPGGCE